MNRSCVSEEWCRSSPWARQPVGAPLCIWDARRETEEEEEETDVVGGVEVAASSLSRSPGKGGGGGGKFGFVGEMSARWSDHYKAHPREPENTELMWWVKAAMRGAK